MLNVILQQGINGIVVGGLYVLVALGLTLIYGVLVQINFAHADIVTLGAFAAYFVAKLLSGNYFIGIAVALVVGGVLGWLINAAIFAPLRERGASSSGDQDDRGRQHANSNGGRPHSSAASIEQENTWTIRVLLP